MTAPWPDHGDDCENGDPREELTVRLPPDAGGQRLDRMLAAAAPALSRARLQALIAAGQVRRDGVVETDASARAQAGADYVISIPPAAPAVPRSQALPLDVLYEDDDLIVVDKPAGMAAHPAPGTPDGTLVNALLHHCAGQLSGIGGVARPGVVHRLDKDTSGVMVAAKTEAAHRGLSALFVRHDIERLYIALTRAAPEPATATLVTRIGRAPFDRQRMAVLKSGGREAVTRYQVERRFRTAVGARAVAARVRCGLETGRTHQIRVHLASLGAPCLGDATYGSGAATAEVRAAVAAAGLSRQALHAAVLGFVHPVTQARLRFETPLPADMARLETELETRFFTDEV